MKLSRKMQRQIEIKIQHAMANEHTRSGHVAMLEKPHDKMPERSASK